MLHRDNYIWDPSIQITELFGYIFDSPVLQIAYVLVQFSFKRKKKVKLKIISNSNG